MEGPSLLLAAEQLAPFIKKKILSVEGNTKVGKERLLNKKVLDIFSWGKHLVFQFDDFALRVHFMLFGSFQATVKNKSVTGDYPKRNRPIRLSLTFVNGHIEMYSCSLRYIEESNAKENYDYSIDILSPNWDGKKALLQLLDHSENEIGDVLLDQSIFAGVGNIIKNESLFLAKLSPETKIKDISRKNLVGLIDIVREYVFNFYKWRKKFELKKHYKIYRKGICPNCEQKVTRKKTGVRQRLSFFCQHCQHCQPCR